MKAWYTLSLNLFWVALMAASTAKGSGLMCLFRMGTFGGQGIYCRLEPDFSSGLPTCPVGSTLQPLDPRTVECYGASTTEYSAGADLSRTGAFDFHVAGLDGELRSETPSFSLNSMFTGEEALPGLYRRQGDPAQHLRIDSSLRLRTNVEIVNYSTGTTCPISFSAPFAPDPFGGETYATAGKFFCEWPTFLGPVTCAHDVTAKTAGVVQGGMDLFLEGPAYYGIENGRCFATGKSTLLLRFVKHE